VLGYPDDVEGFLLLWSRDVRFVEGLMERFCVVPLRGAARPNSQPDPVPRGPGKHCNIDRERAIVAAVGAPVSAVLFQ
jgi:hypothetical protein